MPALNSHIILLSACELKMIADASILCALWYLPSGIVCQFIIRPNGYHQERRFCLTLLQMKLFGFYKATLRTFVTCRRW